jgi:hypothetical protein
MGMPQDQIDELKVIPVVAKVRFPSTLKQPVQEHAGNARAHLERLGWH